MIMIKPGSAQMTHLAEQVRQDDFVWPLVSEQYSAPFGRNRELYGVAVLADCQLA